jgi:hypothetical protein
MKKRQNDGSRVPNSRTPSRVSGGQRTAQPAASLFSISEDGTVLGGDGHVLFFGIERFVSDIVPGRVCFICGSSEDERAFNGEHVLPKWVLRAGAIFDQSITLPNRTRFRYGQYTIRCCAQCNAELSETYENRIRPLISGGYRAVAHYLNDEGSELIFAGSR